MTENGVLENQMVTIRNGVIEKIAPFSKTRHEKEAVIINGTGKYLMPGLAEMHGHIPPVDDLEPMKETLKLFVLNGITTVRGMLGHPRHLELREMIARGELLAPNFYTTGPSFNGMSVTSPEGGAAMVRKQKDAGYDYLKLHPGLLKAEFDSIAKTAHKVDIPFVGHVSFGVGVWHAIASGYSSIDHLDGFVEGMVPGIEKMAEQQTGLFGMFVADQADTARIPELIAALKQHNISVVPTQALAARWMILECQRNGINLLLGCDAPQVFNVPGFSTHQELEYLVKSGLTPYEALQTGTMNVARYLNKRNAGVIREGAISDLILLNGNPLEDIAQTQNIAGVMIGSRWISREDANAELALLRKQTK